MSSVTNNQRVLNFSTEAQRKLEAFIQSTNASIDQGIDQAIPSIVNAVAEGTVCCLKATVVTSATATVAITGRVAGPETALKATLFVAAATKCATDRITVPCVEPPINCCVRKTADVSKVAIHKAVDASSRCCYDSCCNDEKESSCCSDKKESSCCSSSSSSSCCSSSNPNDL